MAGRSGVCFISRTAAHLAPFDNGKRAVPLAAQQEQQQQQQQQQTAAQLRNAAATFARDGFVKLDGYFSAAEHTRMCDPVHAAQRAAGSLAAADASSALRPSDSSTRFNFPDLHTCDDVGAARLLGATLGNSRLVDAVEAMLGEGAEVAQFGALLTRVGDPGAQVHFDYKPYRVLGSSLQWLVVVIPLSDYTPQHGPLMVLPGAHRKTTVLPSADGRVHPVDVGTIPSHPSTTTALVDPHLRRGDLFIFHGFTFHFAAPNHGPERCGLYIKFRAKTAPSACGPLLFPTHLARLAPSLLPYHRNDGTQRIDQGVWILEDGTTNEICVVSEREGRGWHLPSVPISSAQGGPMRPNSTSEWDAGNVIGECLRHATASTGCELGWLSWVADHNKAHTAGDAADEHYIRVYGHISADGALATLGGEGRLPAAAGMVFASVSDLAAGRFGRNTDLSALGLAWIRSWQSSTDPTTGQPVRRGLGLALEGWDRRGQEFLGWQSDAHEALRFDAHSVSPAGMFASR